MNHESQGVCNQLEQHCPSQSAGRQIMKMNHENREFAACSCSTTPVNQLGDELAFSVVAVDVVVRRNVQMNHTYLMNVLQCWSYIPINLLKIINIVKVNV